MQSCTSSNKLTRGKSQKVSQNLDNPKKLRTLARGCALGNLPYTHRRIPAAIKVILLSVQNGLACTYIALPGIEIVGCADRNHR